MQASDLTVIPCSLKLYGLAAVWPDAQSEVASPGPRGVTQTPYTW
jgi:hypothetical protein